MSILSFSSSTDLTFVFPNSYSFNNHMEFLEITDTFRVASVCKLWKEWAKSEHVWPK
jgi:hypothetical protein